jgi:D-alanine-D-alanine ligase
MSRKKIRLAILYGGRSAEHEVSVVSARSVLAAIDRDRYDVVPVAITKEGRWMLPRRGPEELPHGSGALPAVEEEGTDVAIESAGGRATLAGGADGPVDVVLPILHGPYGEDGTVQGLLELAGVPYVGAGVLASALGIDKEMHKRLFSARGLPLARWIHVHASDWRRSPGGLAQATEDEIGYPCFTKPARLGSSIGISKCRSRGELEAGLEEAFAHDDKVLVEEAVLGRELECGVLGNDDPEASVVGEIVPGREFYDYAAKYLLEGSEIRIPAPIPDEVAEGVRRLAVEAFVAIDCAGMARVDFFYEEATGRVVVNEINTIPGFTPISMYPKMWEASGVPYAKLIDRLIELALERHERR